MYERIKELITRIRKASLGKDVRTSIADSIEAINEKTEDLSNRQDCLGSTFEQIILEGGHTDAEVIAARTSENGTIYQTIGKRMDAIELLAQTIKNDLDSGKYDEISTNQEEPNSERVKLWIPCIDDAKEDGTVADPTPDMGELKPDTPETGDVVTIIGTNKNAVISAYYPSENQKDALGNNLIGYPDELVCAAPSAVPLGTKILIKNTGTELDNKIFIVTDRNSNLIIKEDDTYMISICFKTSSDANNFSTQTGNITIGKTATTTTKIATVTANVLTVRSGPSADYGILGYVTNGYKFNVLETYKNTNWIKVDYNEQEAYVNGGYTEITTVTTEQDVIVGESQNTTVNKDNPLFGIDISHHNGNINWTKVKESGVKFAIIRIGYGSRQSSGGVIDSQFANNIKGARDAGIDVGVYFFSYASSMDKLIAEANWVISKLNEYEKGTFTYPIFFDQEYDSLKTNGSYPNYTSYNPGKVVLTNYIKKFYELIENAGYYCGIYANPDWLVNYVNYDEINNYPLWLAHWNVSKPSSNYDCKMWQYGYSTVNGITGQVDVNRCFVDYPSLIKALNKNGF